MKVQYPELLYALFITILSMGCEDDNPQNYLLEDVNVIIKLIDLDSLNYFDEAIIENSSKIAIYQDSALIADSSVNAALDSLESLQDGIDTFNTSLIPLYDELYILYKQDSSLQKNYNATLDSLSKRTITLNSSKSSIQNKKTRISEIEFLHSQVSNFPEDSLTQYSLPLNIADTFSMFRIYLTDTENYSITLRHNIQKKISSQKEILISFDSIQLISHTFRKDSSNCDLCLNDQIPTYIFYY